MERDPNDQPQSPQRGTDSQEALDRALQRDREDLAGDIEQDRNLTGSTTYETLPEQEEE